MAERGDDGVILVHGAAVLEATRRLNQKTVRAVVLPQGSLVDELLTRIAEPEARITTLEDLVAVCPASVLRLFRGPFARASPLPSGRQVPAFPKRA